ncbi:hypothetical protein S40285_10290 [Stachybotrys chlorohalonatus IBT 40285]|uniref:Uncharacterized protein n=1 Tax=Stachybotrys chlorohalonatus (strain IBT 40285) TaxID=1283841 RepID=A0A084QTA6_STAC4|nr:hypothetical protein S40285_10290 [Stachybotrys chlorohalonata IBT 40285]
MARGGYTSRDGSPAFARVQMGDPSLKLPPLLRDHPLPSPSPSIRSRSMHQIQLEMEYDVEEGRNSHERSQSHHWTSEDAATLADDGMDQTTTRIHALCIFDEIPQLSTLQLRSQLIDSLSALPMRRRWGRWRWREQPMTTSLAIMEAIMLYERGAEQGPGRRCSHCRAGQGISPLCVVAPDQVRNGQDAGPCSNCLYDGMSHVCNASGRRTPSISAKSEFGPMDDPDRVVDHMAVLEMIAQLKRPSGVGRDHSLEGRARRIELAATHIAQAARDWGDKISRQSQ